MRNLGEAKHFQAKEEGTLCSSCQKPVADSSRQIVPSFHGMREMRCLYCHEDFCRRASCPTDVRECEVCLETVCKDCEISAQCNDCGQTYCHVLCGMLVECIKCGKISCENCYSISDCCYCEVNVCQDCGHASDVCEGPDCFFCDDCFEGNCKICGDCMCCKCYEVTQCKLCLKTLCRKPTCQDHAAMCGACEQVYCEDCTVMENCGGCNKSFCQRHEKLVDCSECDMRHCRACEHVERCRYCDKACFEECTCFDKKAAKRAKTS